MATIVVSGGGKNVGKTSLICGLLRALPEFEWVAVKIAGHDHGKAEALFEETEAGEETDTARFLLAGARRVFLMTADGPELGEGLKTLTSLVGPAANLIFESNRVLDWIEPTVHLAVGEATDGAHKPSFVQVEHRLDARVMQGVRDEVLEGAPPVFRLTVLERISPELRRWLQERLLRA